MKKWNAPEIKELNLSSTMMHGRDTRFIDGFIYDVEHDTNWASYSGSNPDTTATEADVNIHDHVNP